MDIGTLLQQVKEGTVSPRQAEALLRDLPYEDMGYAKLDHHREARCGFPATRSIMYMNARMMTTSMLR